MTSLRIRTAVAALAICVGFHVQHPARAADAPGFVWLEGEKPAASNVKLNLAGWGSKQFLSGEKWLHVSIEPDRIEKDLPREGGLIRYDFDIPAGEAGARGIWARIGFEFARSPFDWRIDDGPWESVGPEVLTTDLMEIDFFCEAAWLDLGRRELPAGAHTLEFRLPSGKDRDGKPRRVLFALDAICLPAGEFRPNGKFPPGDDGRDPKDVEASKVAFTLPAPASVGARSEVALAGTWEICRDDEQAPGPVAEPITPLPRDAVWRAIPVPGDKNTLRPDLVFAHRVWYRTRVDVPESAAGRSFFLVFPQNNLNTTVYVNGTLCGFDKNPFARVQIDVTKGVRPGRNEVMVGIRDAWYGYSASPTDPLKLRRRWNLPKKFLGDGFQDLAYPIWNHPESGILATPSLVAAGPSYAADVFCKPSVARKALDVEVTLANPGAEAAEGEIACEALGPDGSVLKAFPPSAFRLEGTGRSTLNLSWPWPDAPVWWPDDPRMLTLRTTLSVGGRPVDVSRTDFGFREWTIAGAEFRLNGVPWHGWADTHSHDSPRAWLDFYRSSNQAFMRFWGTSWMGMPPEQALGFLDRGGVVVRRSGIFDGEAIGYNAPEQDPELRKRYNSDIKMDLMQNWRDQVVAQVKGERNHPSIMIWSIENEWLYINCINLHGGLMDQFEDAVVKTSDAVRAADPTRPTMTDGGGATKSNRMPVHGDHYTAGPFPEYPTLAYTPNAKGGGKGRWEWDRRRPRFIGEELFAAGHNPAYAYFGGEEVFAGQQASRRAVGILVRMMTEGLRWTGQGAIHFWQGQDSASGQYASNAPRAAFCRQWDWTFGSGQAVSRTYGVFNDTHDDAPITFTRAWRLGGRDIMKKTSEHRIPPGGREFLEEAATLPEVSARSEGELVLTLSVAGKEVFRDVKAVSILPPVAASTDLAAAGSLGEDRLAVHDPSGAVQAFLKASGVAFREIADPAVQPVPGAARVIVLGKDSVGVGLAATSRLAALAMAGKRVVVLEQETPLRDQAIRPAEMEKDANAGRIAFIEDATHPALRGLRHKDFFVWGPGEVVYRNAYFKPARNARSLVQCHEKLTNSALVEVPVGNGLLLLCQLAVGENLASNAVAQHVLANLVEHAASYELRFQPAVAALEGAAPLASALEKIGLKYEAHSDALAALSAPEARIAVIHASPTNLKAMAEHRAKVDAFCEAGGTIVLNGLTPEGLEDYNAIVGFDHMIRPFTRERVSFPPARHPLTAGLTLADVVLYSSERIFPWQEGNFVSSETFSYVVDLEDVAPFAKYENDFVRMMSNGMVSADGWKYIVNVPAPDAPPLDFRLELPKPQAIREVEWIGNTFYWPVTRFELLLDGKPGAGFDVKPNNEPQAFAVDPPATGRVVTLRLAAWQKLPGKGQVTGLDNIRLLAARPADFAEKVRPMLNVGGMVHYPRGKAGGGIVLCNLKFADRDRDDAPQNPERKRAILAGLLRNLRARFAGGRTVIAGAGLSCTPIDLSKQANQFRDDRGWFGDRSLTFAALPTGRQTLAGVPFEIYEHRTSPVPTAIMLNGPGVPGNLPDAVRGIPVNRKADALFFLQAARIDRRRDAREVREKKADELARYIVTYEDGQTAVVPIRSELDVEDYRAKGADSLPGAQLGWSRKYLGRDETAAAYVQQWNNPRPDVPIRSVDLAYGDAPRRGVPALLALTAATAEASVQEGP